eukprot:2782429-Pleurochrysis_carterae.AAC.2
MPMAAPYSMHVSTYSILQTTSVTRRATVEIAPHANRARDGRSPSSLSPFRPLQGTRLNFPRVISETILLMLHTLPPHVPIPTSTKARRPACPPIRPFVKGGTCFFSVPHLSSPFDGPTSRPAFSPALPPLKRLSPPYPPGRTRSGRAWRSTPAPCARATGRSRRRSRRPAGAARSYTANRDRTRWSRRERCRAPSSPYPCQGCTSRSPVQGGGGRVEGGRPRSFQPVRQAPGLIRSVPSAAIEYYLGRVLDYLARGRGLEMVTAGRGGGGDVRACARARVRAKCMRGRERV